MLSTGFGGTTTSDKGIGPGRRRQAATAVVAPTALVGPHATERSTGKSRADWFLGATAEPEDFPRMGNKRCRPGVMLSEEDEKTVSVSPMFRVLSHLKGAQHDVEVRRDDPLAAQPGLPDPLGPVRAGRGGGVRGLHAVVGVYGDGSHSAPLAKYADRRPPTTPCSSSVACPSPASPPRPTEPPSLRRHDTPASAIRCRGGRFRLSVDRALARSVGPRAGVHVPGAVGRRRSMRIPRPTPAA